MKKLFIIMTLFMSSFFLLSLKKVKAYEFTKELDFSLIEDTLSLKEKLDAYVLTDTTYSDNYIIYLDSGTMQYYLFPDYSIDNFSYTVASTYFSYKYSGNLKSGKNFNSIGSMLGSTSNYQFFIYSRNLNSMVLYQNFDLYYTRDLNSSATYSYNDYSVTYNLTSGSKVMTLYDLYLEYQNSLNTEDPVHKEELMKVENFYNVIIEKLSYLAETIVSNYIYLSIIAIFMLIFVFKLIFRRFL